MINFLRSSSRFGDMDQVGELTEKLTEEFVQTSEKYHKKLDLVFEEYKNEVEKISMASQDDKFKRGIRRIKYVPDLRSKKK